MVKFVKKIWIIWIVAAVLLLPILSLSVQAKIPGNDGKSFEKYSKLPLDGDILMAISRDDKSMISWRKFAEAKLKRDPNSLEGNAILGVVFHCGEGDLPRARLHLEKASKKVLRDLKKGKYNEKQASIFLAVELQLVQVLGEMDAYEEKISHIDTLIKIPSLSFFEVEKAWPLMKLNRDAEAKQIIDRCLNMGGNTRLVALNTLGAMEAERCHYQSSYNTFKTLIDELKSQGRDIDDTFWRNLGECALCLGRFDEAEKLYIEATKVKFKDESYTNPYRDLTCLYIEEAKFPEAVSALQKTNEWSRSLRPYLYQQNMAQETQLTAELLLELGFVPEAVDKLRTLLNRPDRQGGSSSDVDQGEAGNLLTWYAATNVQRECYREATSWLHGWPYFKVKLKILSLNYDMWRTSSRLRALMAENDRIAASLRPYCSQSIDVIECYKPLLVRILGAGTCASALNELSRKAPENFPVEEPFILVNKAEVAYNLGNYKAALKNLEKANVTLPKVVRLERSIVDARLAQLYRRNGDLSKALSLYSSLISSTPTAIRHMNCRIPIQCRSDNSQASKMLVKYLSKSPRFEVGSQGLLMNIYRSNDLFVADLSDSNGRILSTSKTKLTPSNRDTASNLAAEIHNQTFATKINLSSIDINSLDGSNSSGSMARKNFQKLFGVEDKTTDNLDNFDSYQYDNT